MNSIDVSVDFSFQGKHYTPAITINLDVFLAQQQSQQQLQQQLQQQPSSFYQLIAKQHNIDSYSYLYEVMQQSDFYYHNPKGLAIQFLQGNSFDWSAYKVHWQENQILEKLLNIAQKEMNVSDFNNNPALKNSLLQAYQLGIDTATGAKKIKTK